MAKKYSVMYHNCKGNTVFSVRRMYVTKSEAAHKFMQGVEFLRTDYDGFSYVALMRVNSRGEWVVAQYADNVGGCYGES